jgi:hypothetical protein
VRYDLKFTTLQALLTVASFALVIIGWQRARVSLVTTVAAMWLFFYLPAYLVASAQLRRIVATGAREVVERRSDAARVERGRAASRAPRAPRSRRTTAGERGRAGVRDDEGRRPCASAAAAV